MMPPDGHWLVRVLARLHPPSPATTDCNENLHVVFMHLGRACNVFQPCSSPIRNLPS